MPDNTANKIVIKNGTLITASETYQADLLIEGEQINSISQEIYDADAEIFDATGKLILPGG